MTVRIKFNSANLDSITDAFLDSIAKKDPNEAAKYIARGANKNARFADEDTALLYAVRTGDIGMTLMLIATGSSLDAQDKDGATALILAAKQNNPEICRALIDAGADIFIEDRYGRKAWDYASKHPNAGDMAELFTKPLKKSLDRIPTSDFAQALRASHRNLDEIDPQYGETVMTWAASQKGMESIARAFLEAGADPEAPNGRGETPMQIAKAAGNTTMQALLKEAKASAPPVAVDKRLATKPMFSSNTSST